MSNLSSDRQKEVETVIRSCLLSQKGSFSLLGLNKTYREFEGENIPFREFNFPTLRDFLNSLTNVLRITDNNGELSINAVVTDKTRHMNLLVERQRDAKRSKSKHTRKSSDYQRQDREADRGANRGNNQNSQSRSRSRPEQNSNSHPRAAAMSERNSYGNQRQPGSRYRDNARENNSRKEERSADSSERYYPTVDRRAYYQKPENKSENENDHSAQRGIKSDYNHHSRRNQAEGSEHQDAEFDKSYHVSSNSSLESNKSAEDASVNRNAENGGSIMKKGILFNPRTKNRLHQLMEHHPEGIWCAEFPQKYLDFFDVSFHYSSLGFNSIREVASELPEIFHCVNLKESGDYKLFDARKPCPEISKIEQRVPQFNELLRPKNNVQREAFPKKLDPNTSERFIPEGAMEVTESVGQINVTELFKANDYETVVVSEIYNPSNFFVQLENRVPHFRELMRDLHYFYEEKKSMYQMCPIMLEKNLNIACVFERKWHRGLIKSIKADGRAEIFFYDYGTLKSYEAKDLFFLHRKFSYLPAQAISCALYNVKPYEAKTWESSISYEFNKKVNNIPLIATIGSEYASKHHYINLEENSMCICLTDTRKSDDFHINDWMFDMQFASQGRVVRNKIRNFAFPHYLDCITKKGFDKSVIYNVNESNMNMENPILNYGFNQLKKLPKYSHSSREENPKAVSTPSPTVSRSSSLAGSSEGSESPNTTSSNKSGGKLEMLLRLHSKTKNAENTKDQFVSSKQEISNQRSVKKNDSYVDSDDSIPQLKKISAQSKKSDSNFVSETSESDSFSVHSPLIFKKDTNEDKDVSFFGTFRSEYGGCGRMEQINWSEIRESVYQGNPPTETSKPLEISEKLTGKYSRDADTSMKPARSKSNGSSSKSSGSSSKSNGYSPKYNGYSSKSNGYSSKSNGYPRKSDGYPPKSGENVPKYTGTIPKSTGTEQKSISSVPKSFGTLPKSVNSLSKFVDSSSQVETSSTVVTSDKKNEENPPKLRASLLRLVASSAEVDVSSSKFDVSSSNPVVSSSEGASLSKLGVSSEKPVLTSPEIGKQLGVSPAEVDVSSPKPPVSTSSKIGKQLPLIKSAMSNIVNADSNSAYYEKDVGFLPSGNIKPSVANVSPLLKLKQKLHANSSKSISILVTSKIAKILKGQLEELSGEDDAKNSMETVKDSISLSSEEEMKKMEEKEEKEEIVEENKARSLAEEKQNKMEKKEERRRKEEQRSETSEILEPRKARINQKVSADFEEEVELIHVPNAMSFRKEKLCTRIRSESLDSDDLSSSAEEELSENEVVNPIVQQVSNQLMFNDEDINSDAETWDGMSFMSNDLPRKSKSAKSMSSRNSSPERKSISLNESVKSDFVNFDYSDRQKLEYSKKTISSLGDRAFGESPKLDKNSFSQKTSETSTLDFSFEPPGRLKSLKAMLSRMCEE